MTGNKEIHIDCHQIQMLLNERREVALILSANDVIAMRPDLSIEQAWEVLQHIKRHHEAGDSDSWNVIDSVAWELFGPEPIFA